MQVFFKLFLLLLAFSYQIGSSPISESSDAARVVNGYEVDIEDVPYQASLKRKVLSGWAHMCGAVLVTPRGLLTAAHCVTSYNSTPALIRVTVGTSNRASGGKTYEVSSIVIHEAYSSVSLEHDIAILVTAKTISFSQTIRPISIAEPLLQIPAGTVALVSGFGTTSFEGISSSTLLAAQVNIVSQATCARAYLRIASIRNGMICANASDPPRDACQGDSGGPLVAFNNLIGLVSWGEGCAESAYPGVYTRVSEYFYWFWHQIDVATT